MLTPEYVNLYIELLSRGLIGILFTDGGHHRLTPLDAIPQLASQIADPISESDLIRLIDGAHLTMLRIDAKSEASDFKFQIKIV